MIKNKPNSSARRRDLMWRKAHHKQRLDHAISYSCGYELGWYMYNNLHQYSKNKIHCSCPDCSPKTRNKGHRRYRKGNYSRSMNYKMSELRKKLKMDENERDYFNLS